EGGAPRGAPGRGPEEPRRHGDDVPRRQPSPPSMMATHLTSEDLREGTRGGLRVPGGGPAEHRPRAQLGHFSSQAELAATLSSRTPPSRRSATGSGSSD